MSQVTALLVTHDAQRWIEPLLASIADQTRVPDSVVVVDDHSRDGTTELLRRALGQRLVLLAASTAAGDRTTRIARNFEQGLRACRDHGVVVLGDHDDVWHPTRVEHQVGILERRPDLAMVASDGRLVDGDASPLGGTLRSTFPVPPDFVDQLPAARMRTALRYLVATGGASALRPAAFAPVSIPDGWLHDRWWSLVATARESMLVDDEAVIDYRVSPNQQVGLDSGNVHGSAAARLVSAAARLGPSVRKLGDIRRELTPLATPQTAVELVGWRLLRNLL